MTNDPETLLRSVTFFKHLDRVDVARLVGAVDEVRLPAGSLLFAEGDPADALYLLASGRVDITVSAGDDSHSLGELVAPAHFGDLGLLLERRSASVRAVTDIEAWRLSRERFERLARERPAVGLAVARSLAELLDQRSREHAGIPRSAPPSAASDTSTVVPRPRRSVRRKVVGGALAIAVPLALWPLGPPAPLSVEAWHVALIVIGAAIGWIFEPVPDFAVALLMIAAWGLTGLVPLAVSFSGFVSSSWVLALGSLAIAAAMANSGLLFRIALLLLKVFPRTHAGQVLALLAGGVVITPLVPLGVARLASVMPLARELSEALGYQARSRGSAAIAFAGFVGYNLFGPIFLTGFAINFFILELVPAAERDGFTWFGWLQATAPAGIVLFVGATAAILLLFPADTAPRATAALIARQERALGRLSGRELGALAATATLVGGLILQPLLRVDTAWLALIAVGITVVASGMDRERFRGNIEWGFLMLFGVLLGMDDALARVGLDRVIADAALDAVRGIGDPALIVALLAALVVLARLVLPAVAFGLLLLISLIPVAPQVGVSGWVIGFITVVMIYTWLVPAQSGFTQLAAAFGVGDLFTTRHVLLMGLALTTIALLMIAVSVPYWRAIGLVG